MLCNIIEILPNGARISLNSLLDSVMIKRLIRDRMVCEVMTPTNVQRHCLQVKAGAIPALPPLTFFPHLVALFLAASFTSAAVSFAFSRIRTDDSRSKAIDDFFSNLGLPVIPPPALSLLYRNTPSIRTIVKSLIFNLCQLLNASSFRNALTCFNGVWMAAAAPIS